MKKVIEAMRKFSAVFEEAEGELLRLEKERRGLPPSSLVFVGMANVADQHWCPMQSVLKSRAREDEFFHAYLHDRVKYSLLAGLIGELPARVEDWLAVGDTLTLTHVNALLSRAAAPDVFSPRGPAGDAELRRMNWRERGERAEEMYAEKYPSIRWNFAWGGYVVVGYPDGITDGLVYEFKATGKAFFIESNRRKAFTQADLYGTFFRRPVKRVQVRVLDSEETLTWEEAVDTESAESSLARFAAVDRGELPPRPADYKCRSCDHRDSCPLIDC
jgi:hypothetical protein